MTLQHDLAQRPERLQRHLPQDAGHDEPATDTLKVAISEVAEQATCTAIFALGLCTRTHMAAHQN